MARLLWGWITFAGLVQAAPQPGLEVTFVHSASGQTDTEIRPNLWLYAPAGQPPTPFLAEGAFTATWRGWVRIDLRGEYQFHARLNGQVLVRVNGRTVLEGKTSGGLLSQDAPIRLHKGTNALEVVFTSPPSGDAWLRVEWSRTGEASLPLPSSDLSHDPTAAGKISARLRLGRELFAVYRCAKCHEPSPGTPVMHELRMDAPGFAGIGSRLDREWMTRWIKNPGAERSDARMPQLFHGETADADAAAAAAFLSSLTEPEADGYEPSAAGDPPEGERLFSSLLCTACHAPPGDVNAGKDKSPLDQAARKFQTGALVDYLMKPQAHDAWSPMPDFRLSHREAEHLAAFLLSRAAASPGQGTAASRDHIESGRRVVQTAGCLSCHTGPLANEFRAKPLAELKGEHSVRGCLDERAAPDSTAPRFRFSPEEQAALTAFLGTDRVSLSRQVDADFAARQVRRLHCAGCHGTVEGLPAFDLLGGKLKPEWMEAFLAGRLAGKPRPWLEARMPFFPNYASGLARGLAAQHGLAPVTPAEEPVDTAAVEIGRRLVSSEGGLACVTCHAVGNSPATLGSEGTGINLALSHGRLQRDFFGRWMRNPVAIDRTTKMPVYFDERGRSPLNDMYEGDAHRQIHALWEYLRSGVGPPP